jgi:hypothetical protein
MAARRDGTGLPVTGGWTSRVFSFPNPVNEVSARMVAGGVVLLSLVTIVFDQPWLTAVIAYGFVARVLSGPKRFAQAIGVAFSVSAAVLALALGLTTAAYAVLGALIVAATLESVFGLCLGCRAFALLMSAGVIPEEVCERCNNITAGRAGHG